MSIYYRRRLFRFLLSMKSSSSKQTQVDNNHTSKSKIFQRNRNEFQKFVDLRSKTNRSPFSIVQKLRQSLCWWHRHTLRYSEKTFFTFSTSIRYARRKQHIDQIEKSFHRLFNRSFIKLENKLVEIDNRRKKAKNDISFVFFKHFSITRNVFEFH